MPRVGHDYLATCLPWHLSHFNPRAPRGARQSILDLRPSAKSISIHVPREGHDDDYRAIMQADAISIHVPREGHDYRWKNLPCSLSNFNPRAPRGARLYKQTALFLLDIDFNPRAPRGARQRKIYWRVCCHRISIHVPREGHDEFCVLVY